ncbi:MAG: lysophospholipid acyltransferase family protein [Chthoniobacterales bacterium]
MENAAARRIFSHAGRLAARVLLTPLVRVHLHRPSGPIPRGRMILASNHISHFDPPVIGAYFPRQLDWMAMEELFRNPWSARLLGALGAFPVDRGAADRVAIRTALCRLETGAALGIFPEGGIRAGEGSILCGAPMRPGVAVLAMMAQAPVVPCVIQGSERLYHRQNWRPLFRIPIWIGVGKPLTIDPRLTGAAARTDLCGRLQTAMIELQAELVAHFQLHPDDLPKSPQARKGEDPYLVLKR